MCRFERGRKVSSRSEGKVASSPEPALQTIAQDQTTLDLVRLEDNDKLGRIRAAAVICLRCSSAYAVST